MICGNCKGNHGSVAEVRSCYDGERGAVATMERPDDFRERMRQNAGTPPPATEKQQAFLATLLRDRDHDYGDEVAVASLTKSQASEMIDRLLKCETSAKAPGGPGSKDFPPADVLPAGWYAIPTEPGARNSLAFYQVDRPEKGRWKGYCFISMVIGGRENRRLNIGAQKGIAGRIVEEGVEESALRYGREIGQCCRCNRHLTNEESRAKGIGPVCEGAGGGFF